MSEIRLSALLKNPGEYVERALKGEQFHVVDKSGVVMVIGKTPGEPFAEFDEAARPDEGCGGKGWVVACEKCRVKRRCPGCPDCAPEEPGSLLSETEYHSLAAAVPGPVGYRRLLAHDRALRAENERLRAALQGIRPEEWEYLARGHPIDPQEGCRCATCARHRQVRTALQQLARLSRRALAAPQEQEGNDG